MKKKTILHWLGLTGLVAFLSYALAVFLSPLAYPGYNWMAQAVSDLSAETAPSKQLWSQLSAFYDVLSPVCSICVVIFVASRKTSTKLFRIGIYLFAAMNFISAIGYKMFPLVEAGKDIHSFQEVMHIVVTALVVLLSISSLVLLIIAGCRDKRMRAIAIFAIVALLMMMVGSAGTGLVPKEYFGIAERFSVFAAVGFTAVLGVCQFVGLFDPRPTERN